MMRALDERGVQETPCNRGLHLPGRTWETATVLAWPLILAAGRAGGPRNTYLLTDRRRRVARDGHIGEQLVARLTVLLGEESIVHLDGAAHPRQVAHCVDRYAVAVILDPHSIE